MDPKSLANRIAAEGSNALLNGTVKQAVLDAMAELALSDPRADVSEPEVSLEEAAALAALPVERSNVANTAGRVTPSSRWQGFIDLSQRAGGLGTGYGPLNGPAYVRDPTDSDGNGCLGDVAVGAPLYGNQRLMAGAPKSAAWWACSPMVNAILSAALNAGPLYRRAGGAKVETQLALASAKGGFREYVSPCYEGKPVSWAHLLEHDCPQRGSVNVALISFLNKKTGKWRSPSHVVFVIDCDKLELHDPNTGARCKGLWRFAADGSFHDVPNTDAVAEKRPGAYRAYSGKRTVWRPVAADDSGRATLHRVVELRPDGLTPSVFGGVYHLHDICGLRVRLAS